MSVAGTRSTSASNNIRERAAGLVITDAGKAKPSTFLLLHQRNGRHWGFPKGRIEDGETEEAAALREAQEETGLAKFYLVPGFRVVTTYTFTRGSTTVSKEVVYFLARVEDCAIVLSPEHTAGCWLSYEVAYKQLTYEDTREILSKARDYLSSQIAGYAPPLKCENR